MSGSGRPEFSRLVALARLGAMPFRQEIAASQSERGALARRFDLIALDRLSATIEVTRRADNLFLLHAAFTAEFVQSCVVTLDPVGGAVAEAFSLLYGPPEVEAQAGQSVEDEVAFEPLLGNTIDIGEAVAQQFSLALPPFPRSPEATLEAEAPPADDAGPLAAALSRVVPRRGE